MGLGRGRLARELRGKVVDAESFSNVINLIVNSVPGDVEPYVVRGLRRVSRVYFVKPFTALAWLLAMYGALGMVREGSLIIYYNEGDVRWSAATLIHEAIHEGLGLRRDGFNVLIDESMAYLACFRSGFHDLFHECVNQGVKFLSACVNPYEGFELLNTVLPSIIAYELKEMDFRRVLRIARTDGIKGLINELIRRSDEDLVKAVATGLKELGFKGIEELIEEHACPSVNELRGWGSYRIEGADDKYVEMMSKLAEAVEEGRLEPLKPWVKELGSIEKDVEAFIKCVKRGKCG